MLDFFGEGDADKSVEAIDDEEEEEEHMVGEDSEASSSAEYEHDKVVVGVDGTAVAA